ncbi:MAG: matrixin family metalloprotease [Myxococcota bacterium]|jgi:hypothetical protein|nr:matrixin family metalloprotease [Myxococcota bacterium]
MKIGHLILASLIAFVPKIASAYNWYPLDDYPDRFIRWYQPNIPVFLDDRPPLNAELEDVVQTITKSINTWNNVQCDHPIFDDIEMVIGQLPVVEKEKVTEGTNLIVFQNSEEWDHYHPTGDNPAIDWPMVLALTTLYYDPVTGEINSYSLEINDERFRFTTTVRPRSYDIENTITHELGHVLGLDHPDDDLKDATMYAKALTGETKKRTLETDDIEGLCNLYGDNWPDEPPEDPSRSGGCSSIGDSMDTKQLAAWAALLAAVIFFIIRRRGR